MINPRLAALITIVVGAALLRLAPHPPNLTPITAVALFGGAYFSDKRLALLAPLAALFLSDLFIAFHHQMPVVYGSFAVIVGIGLWLQRRRTAVRIAAAALASSVVFFVLTNFGLWATTSYYPHTFDGLVACYIAAIPWFRNTVVGDLFYTAILFGGFALLERRFAVLRQPVTAVRA